MHVLFVNMIVGQSWLWANLGLPTVHVCCFVSVLTGIELCT